MLSSLMVTITFTDSYRVKRRIRSSYITPTRGHGRGAAGGGLENRTDDARRATGTSWYLDDEAGRRLRAAALRPRARPREPAPRTRTGGCRRVGIGTPARTHTLYHTWPASARQNMTYGHFRWANSVSLLRTARQRDRSLASPQVPSGERSTARLTPLSQLSARCLDRPAPPRAPTPSLPRAKTRPAVAA
jgi:hypothetical protein